MSSLDPDQLPLFGPRGGTTFDAARDTSRLNRQALDVWKVMRDGQWHTLPELSARTGHPEASISARLRDLRKPKYGSRIIQRQHVSQGLWEYRYVALSGCPECSLEPHLGGWGRCECECHDQ